MPRADRWGHTVLKRKRNPQVPKQERSALSLPRMAWLAALALLCVPQGAWAQDDADVSGGHKKLYAQGRAAELQRDYDKALALFEGALAQRPGDPRYELALRRIRFVAGQAHVDLGQQLREQGQLAEALAHFERAAAIDPASTVAVQERRLTLEAIEAREQGEDLSGLPASPALREQALRQKRMGSLKELPDLAPLSSQPINIKIPSQQSKVVFETIGKLAGVNMLFDPDYQDKKISVELQNATLFEALDYVSLLAKAYWKPLTHNAVFITNDNANKRRDYEEEVVKTFYLNNVATPQEMQEIATAIRGLTDVRRIFPVNSMNAMVVRTSSDKMAIVEKVINDVDKAKPEVVVDVLVIESSKSSNRDLGLTPVSGGSNGISLPVTYTGGGEGGAVTLDNIGNAFSSDQWSTTLPSYQISAVLSRSNSKLLQAPRVRAADNFKASLRIGDRIPIATGSFQPGVGGVGINPLVNTQFNYQDVGVNVDLTPKIHSANEVSMHIELEVSNVREFQDIGGIEQPVIGQRKVTHDVRIREGEASVIGGLFQTNTFQTRSGVPFLADIPVIGRLFGVRGLDVSENEILFVLVPHVVRLPSIDDSNLRGVASGTDQIFRVRYEQPKNGKSALPPTQAESGETPVTDPSTPAAPTTAATETPTEAAVTPEQPVPGPESLPAPEAETPAAQPNNRARPEQGVALTFNPAQPSVEVGGSVKVMIGVRNATQLFSTPLRISFDPKVVRLAQIEKGGFLQGDGQNLIFSQNIRNEMGQAAVNLSRFPRTGGMDGDGVLIELTFEGVAAGTATVRVTPTGARGADRQVVQVAGGTFPLQVQ